LPGDGRGTFALAGEEVSVGRDHTNALAINDRSVSGFSCFAP